MSNEKTFTRRSFLTGAAAATSLAAVGMLAGCAPERAASAAGEPSVLPASGDNAGAPAWLGEPPAIADEECVETVDVEVLVVGAGTSGYFCAASAAESGARTLLIEKNVTGNNIRSAGLASVGSKYQKAEGERGEIDPIAIVNDMDRYGLGQIRSDLVMKWALNSGEAIDWFADLIDKAQRGVGLVLEWNMPEGTFYADWPTGHGTVHDDPSAEYGDREVIIGEILNEYIASFDGCEVRFNTPMQCLIVENDKVVGAYAESKDGLIRINASKGVVVATGGYSRNVEMYQDRQAPRVSCLGAMNDMPSSTGDGIKALLWIGATMDDTPTSMTFNRCLLLADQEVGAPYDTGGDYGYFTYGSQPFLRVDAHGKRFHNESAPYDFVFSALVKHPEGERYWHQVWDGNWKEDVKRFHTVGCSSIYVQPEGGCGSFGWDGMLEEWIEPEMAGFVEDGHIVKADTLDELADLLGLVGADKENFLSTCERQNENFDNQIDPDFGKEPFRLSALRTPPFYATVKSCGLTLCTLDGIKVNSDLQPYGSDGTPIEGVYVIGNDQGSYYAGTYPNLAAGYNAGRGITFGRLVGKALAAK